MKAFKELTRTERMDELLGHVNEILNRIHPGRGLGIVYVKMDDAKLSWFTEWNRKYFALHTGEEYFMVYEDDGKTLLYVVNITADSDMTALDELFRLLGRKF